MKELIFNIGYPRTGSTSLRNFLFPHHTDLNYLDRFDKTLNHLKITQCLVKLTKDQYNSQLNDIIEMAKSLKLMDNKTNLIADEFITNYSVYYDNEGDDERTIARTIKRAKYIFEKINVNIKVCFMIRNQCDLILSLYRGAASLSGGSMKFTLMKS